MVEVRSVLRGRRLTPEETFASYIAPEDYDSPLNRVHLIGALSGGGNKVDLALRTNQMMTDFLLQIWPASPVFNKYWPSQIQMPNWNN